MFKVTVKGLFAHKLRFALTALAVMLGVSFLSGTLVLTDTIQRTFNELFANVNKGTDAYVRSSEKLDSQVGTIRPRIPASLIPEIGAVDGVASQDGTPVVQGQLQFSAQLVDKKGEPIGNPGQGAPTFGFIWDDFEQLSPWKLDSGQPPRADDEVVIDKGSADKGDFKVGDEVSVLTQAAPAKYKLVGIAKFGTADNPGGASVSLFTQAEAQRLAGAPNQFDGIAVGGEDGVSQAELAHRIAQAIDLPKIEVITGDTLTKENQDEIQKNLSFFNTFLLIFALVALFVGSFIIFNTFSIIVAQRTREMALLRAIGASGRQVVTSVLGESLVVGFLASLLGLGIGILLAGVLKALLSAFGIDIPAGGTVLKTRTVVVALAVGTFVTFMSSVFPARRAAKVPPVAAMREVSTDQTGNSIVRIVIGVVVTVLGVGALALGLVQGEISLVGVGAVVVFLGVAFLGPIIARYASALLGSRPIAVLVFGAGALMTLALGLGAIGALVGAGIQLFDGEFGTALLLVLVAALAAVLAASCVNLVVAARAAFRIEGRLGTDNAERNPKRTSSTSSRSSRPRPRSRSARRSTRRSAPTTSSRRRVVASVAPGSVPPSRPQ